MKIIRSILFSAAALWANWNDTSPGIDLDKLPRFPMTLVRSGWLEQGSPATFDGITAVQDDQRREVKLSGKGNSGKQWEVRLHGLYEVWKADLDGNGTTDYALAGGGPYFNGRRTPLYSLCILLMDKEGLPIPFFTVVYHGGNGNVIKHLVDLNQDGKAELLISSYDENISDPRVGGFCSGHWVSQVHRFRNLAVEEIRGTVGNLTFPFVNKWSYYGLCATQPEPLPVEPPSIEDHGTSAVTPGTTLALGTDNSGVVLVKPLNRCTKVRAGVIVYDQATLRRIAFPIVFQPYPIQAEVTEAIRRERAAVTLRGTRRSDGLCFVGLLWATPSPQK